MKNYIMDLKEVMEENSRKAKREFDLDSKKDIDSKLDLGLWIGSCVF